MKQIIRNLLYVGGIFFFLEIFILFSIFVIMAKDAGMKVRDAAEMTWDILRGGIAHLKVINDSNRIIEIKSMAMWRSFWLEPNGERVIPYFKGYDSLDEYPNGAEAATLITAAKDDINGLSDHKKVFFIFAPRLDKIQPSGRYAKNELFKLHIPDCITVITDGCIIQPD
jgi:hypothetical protein